MSAVGDSRDRLVESWKILRIQWQSACELWDDSVRRRFERAVWQDFERAVPAAVQAADELNRAIAAFKTSER